MCGGKRVGGSRICTLYANTEIINLGKSRLYFFGMSILFSGTLIRTSKSGSVLKIRSLVFLKVPFNHSSFPQKRQFSWIAELDIYVKTENLLCVGNISSELR